MNRVERLEKALEVARNLVTTAKNYMSPGGHMHTSYCQTLERIDSILAPPPAYEDVEVEHWKGWNKEGKLLYDAEEQPVTWCGDFPLVKLTGTYRRPLPAPVEKMARGIAAAGSVVLGIGEDVPPLDTRCVIMWEEDQ